MLKSPDAAARFNQLLATDRQAEVLDVIRRLGKKLKRTPSVREIAGECGIQLNAVNAHLQALRRKRYLTSVPRAGRSFVVLKGIPFLGEIS